MAESGAAAPVQEYQAALAGFAADMRALYEASGSPTLKELNARSVEAKRLTLSPSGIYEVLHGKRFPSMNYALEVVRLLALGSEAADSDIVGWWRQRWLTVERLQRAARSAKREAPVAQGETASAELSGDGAARDWQGGAAGVQVGSSNLQVNNYFYGFPPRAGNGSPLRMPVAGLGVVADRFAYEQMVRDMLNEAVRDLNRSEGAKHLGGLSLALQYRSEYGIIFDAAVTSGQGKYVAIEVRHSYSRVALMEMSFTLRQVVNSAPKPEGFKFLFISNREPVSTVDVEYLNQVSRPGIFNYVRVADAKDFPKVVWVIRAGFQIHG
jgi:hypothetical protein